MKMLIVDDSSVIRQRISRVAKDPRLPEFKIVGMARDGVEALRIFSRNLPDVITMDLTMPQMDGIACIEAMIELKADTSILVVSALGDKATALRALMKGAQGFLYKPFTDDQLVAALEEIIS